MRKEILLTMLLFAAAPGCTADVLAPFRPPPAVSITVASAVARTHHATIVWRVEHGSSAPYLIERRHASDPWKRLTYLSVEGGRLVLEDFAVLPGEPYTYRVRLGRDAASGAVGEVTVVVPN